MGAKRYISDSSGTTRHIRKRFIADSSGTTRLIKKRYVADASGVGRLTFLFADQFTGVAGLSSGGALGYGIGYFEAVAGTIVPSPPLLAGGAELRAIYNHTGLNGASLYISGFASNPGAAWLIFANVNGLVKTPSDSGATYTFGTLFNWGNTAQWNWPSAWNPPQGFSGGTAYTVLISHN